MINHNLLLYSLYDRTYSITFNGQPWLVNYTEGDLFELNKKLLMSETKYPINWLQTGYKVREYRNGKIELQNCNFFLITKGDQHDLYKKRYEKNYQNMLFPMFENFKEVIRKTRGIEILNDTIDFVELPFNEVSELTARDGKNGTKRNTESATVPDIWDAIVIDGLNLKINEDCFPQFKIKK